MAEKLGFNFFDAVVECIDFVNASEKDPQITKQDTVDGMRSRLSIMVSRIASGRETSCVDAYSMCGWKVVVQKSVECGLATFRLFLTGGSIDRDLKTHLNQEIGVFRWGNSFLATHNKGR